MVLVAAMNHAPRLVRAVGSSRGWTPSRRSARSRPSALCHRSQKHFRMCRRIHPSSWKTVSRASASWKIPSAPHIPDPSVAQLVTGSTLVAGPHLPHLYFESPDTLRRYSDPLFAIQSKAQELAFPDPPRSAFGGVHLQSQMLVPGVPTPGRVRRARGCCGCFLLGWPV